MQLKIAAVSPIQGAILAFPLLLHRKLVQLLRPLYPVSPIPLRARFGIAGAIMIAIQIRAMSPGLAPGGELELAPVALFVRGPGGAIQAAIV